MILFDEGKLRPVSFVEFSALLTGKLTNILVVINSENYGVGKNYMIRLEKEDLAPGNAAVPAKAGGMSVARFNKRFSCLVA